VDVRGFLAAGGVAVASGAAGGGLIGPVSLIRFTLALPPRPAAMGGIRGDEEGLLRSPPADDDEPGSIATSPSLSATHLYKTKEPIVKSVESVR